MIHGPLGRSVVRPFGFIRRDIASATCDETCLTSFKLAREFEFSFFFNSYSFYLPCITCFVAFGGGLLVVDASTAVPVIEQLCTTNSRD